MRKYISIIPALLACSMAAQERSAVSGRIIGPDGAAVEYASVGICGRNIGTLSASNGEFTLNADIMDNDSVKISHISYKDTVIAAVALADRSIPVVMQARKLDEVVVYGGKKKKGRLAGRGMRIPGAATMWSTAGVGSEIGSMIETEKMFEVKEIAFKVRSNSIEGARLRINIYNEKNGFQNVLHSPIYIIIPVSGKKQEFNVAVNGDIIMEPGKYFVSVMFVDYDREAMACSTDEGRICFPLYLKDSYRRNGVMGELESISVNMGLAVRGNEYR